MGGHARSGPDPCSVLDLLALDRVAGRATGAASRRPARVGQGRVRRSGRPPLSDRPPTSPENGPMTFGAGPRGAALHALAESPVQRALEQAQEVAALQVDDILVVAGLEVDLRGARERVVVHGWHAVRAAERGHRAAVAIVEELGDLALARQLELAVQLLVEA